MTATIPVGSRVDLWAVALTIPGHFTVPCQSWSGGAADSEEGRTRPAGGLPEVSIGGRAVMENVTVTLSLASGSGVTPAVHRRLRSLTGRSAAVVSQTPLDANRVAFGAEQLVCNGTLKRVGPIEADANGSDPTTFEVEITAVSDSAGGGA